MGAQARLTPRHLAFLSLVDEGHTELDSYCMAYEIVEPHKRNNARTALRELRSHPLVGPRLAAIRQRLATSFHSAITQDLVQDPTDFSDVDRVGRQLAKSAFAELTDVISWDEGGHNLRIKASSDIGILAKAGLKKFSIKRSRRVVGHGEDAEDWVVEDIQIEMRDSHKALELVGKHLGMFAVRVTHTDDDIEELRRLAEESGIDPDIAEERYRALLAKPVN